MSRAYHSFIDGNTKHQPPMEDVIRTAISVAKERHPGARLTTLLLHPVHLPALGTWQVIDGKTWMLSYLPIVGPREVRVGPVD